MSLFYLHSLLTTLAPFRRFYPFGMARTLFQHVNPRTSPSFSRREQGS